jgi:hypothetical protein
MVGAHPLWHGDVAMVVEPLSSPFGTEKPFSPSKICDSGERSNGHRISVD